MLTLVFKLGKANHWAQHLSVSGFWPLQQCEVRYWFHLMKLALNPNFRMWLVTPITSVPLMHQYTLLADLCCGSLVNSL